MKYWHLASFDAPTVAAVWACAFAWAAGVRVSSAIVAVLALVVWAIYVIDRLLDARAGLADPHYHALQERHWFHWRHRRWLGSLAALATIVAGCMVEIRLPAPALRRDSLMGLATLAYFSGVHGRAPRYGWANRLKGLLARVISRELLVGVIFSAGCLLPSLTGAGLLHVCAVLAVPAAAFAALAWLNVRAIGCWESSTAGAIGATRISRIAFWLAAVAACAAAMMLGTQPRVSMLLILTAASALALAGLDAARDRIEPVTLRAAADLVLLMPLLLLVPMELLPR